MKSVNNKIGFLLWLVVVGVAGGVAALFSPAFYPEWYGQLAKPSWTPPDALFAPVWTLLYILMAVSAWRIWKEGGWNENGRELGLFLVQLAFNAAWMPIFFGMQAIETALAEITFLLGLIALTIRAFYPVDRRAAQLLYPYFAWVLYATALTYAIWQLN